MTSLVLDAWAVMAWLKGQQPAAERVRSLLDTADRRLVMNIMNLGEVFYLSVKARNLAYGEQVLETLRPRIAVTSATDALVLQAAKLKARYAVSYADAFAAATAMERRIPLVTGDPELRDMAGAEQELQLEWIAG